VDADKSLQKYGSVIIAPKTQWPTQSPYLNIMLSAMKQMNSFASELGITPSSRGRVQTVKVEKKDPKKRFFGVVG
jgi:P27 family predicted phage terminase small subunit